MPVLKSIASGHGCGKTALHSWIGWWALSTCPHTKVRTTANTATQLKSTSVPEAAKWAALALNKDWFRADGMQIVAADPRYRLTWRWDFVTWSPTNTEAFAGLHNKGRRVVMLFDEASGIPPKVWAPAEGILTDEATEIIWLVTGNPTQPEGRFFECFGKERARWHGVQIDSRRAPTRRCWMSGSPAMARIAISRASGSAASFPAPACVNSSAASWPTMRRPTRQFRCLLTHC
jgi:hypothetical protein